MNSNTCSNRLPEGLRALAADIDELATQDLTGLPEGVRAERVLALRRLVDRLEGQWLGELAGVDASGAAGADQGIQAASTANWLRNRLHLGAAAATSCVRTARALFRGPLTGTAQALCDGELSAAHASALAHGTHHLPTQVSIEAEPVLVDAARHLDPPRLRRAVGHLVQATDPDAADHQASGATGGEASGGPHRGRHGRPPRTARPRGRPDPDRGPGPPDPPGHRRRCPQRRPAPRRRPDRAGPPQPGGRPAPPDRRGPPPTQRHRRPGQPPRPPRRPRRRGRRGRPPEPRGVPAAGLRRGGHPGGRHPPPHRPLRPTPGEQSPRREGPRRMAAGGHGLAAPDPRGARRPSRWMSGGPAGSSPRPSAPPWPSATGAVCSPTAPGPSPGVRATTYGIGSMAAPPTWPIWPWCAEPTIGRSMRGAGS